MATKSPDATAVSRSRSRRGKSSDAQAGSRSRSQRSKASDTPALSKRSETSELSSGSEDGLPEIRASDTQCRSNSRSRKGKAPDIKARSKSRSQGRTRGYVVDKGKEDDPEDEEEEEEQQQHEDVDTDDLDDEELEKRRQRERATPHFKWKRGLALGEDGRYTVQSQIGEGTFGRVFSCLDERTKKTVAVKVVKGVKRYCEDAKVEAEVLQEIARCDPTHKSRCVIMLDSFKIPKHHYCLVFEMMDTSVRDFLKGNGNKGLLLRDVRKMSQQFLDCLVFLHSIGLVHTDLKCRNLMLCDARYDVVTLPRAEKHTETRSLRCCDIKVIDFGGACFRDECHDGRIGTRQYRAPEVVLGLNWDEKSDIWSAACIICMLYLGERPFQVHESREHLALMERFNDCPIPSSMAKRAREKGGIPDDIEFDAKGCLVWPYADADEEAIDNVELMERLTEIVAPHHESFLKLLQGLFEFEPERRLSAKAALQQPFFANAADIPE